MKTNWERLTDAQREECWRYSIWGGSVVEHAESAINSLPPEIFDAAERLAAIKRILDNAYDSTLMYYDVQSVNVAHRIASGGEMPCETTATGGNHD